jgi:hypothetical protein
VNEGAFRGIVLVAVAVIVGLILLGSGLDDSVSTARQDGGSSASDDNADTDEGDTDTGGDDSIASPVDPSQINVLVANGAGVTGAAATISTQLTELGYTPLAPTDTVVETTATPLDVVYYQSSPNTQPQAMQVASDLGLDESTVQPYPADPATAPAPIGLAQVLVVLGSAPGQLVTPPGTGTTLPAG